MVRGARLIVPPPVLPDGGLSFSKHALSLSLCLSLNYPNAVRGPGSARSLL